MKICCKIFLLISLAMVIQGCEDDISDFRPLSGGFGIVSKWVGVDTGPGAKLFYKSSNESKARLIWPFVKGGVAFTNDLVFFIGDMPDDQNRLGSGTYFVAQAPGPAF